MNYSVTGVMFGAILLISTVCPSQTASTPQARNSLSIVFKDGHQKCFSLIEVSRIEFKNSSVILTRGGREETIPLADIVRIDFDNNSSPLGRNHFLGKWKVGNGVGGVFT